MFLSSFSSYTQEDTIKNMEVLSILDVGENASDIWGYVDSSGTEYAIIGTHNFTKIYSLTDPSQPALVGEIPGVKSVWRDIKSFGDKVYVVADQGKDGLLQIDMSSAPDTISHKFINLPINVDGLIDTVRRCHNLYVDDEGVLYLAGCNTINDLLMYDVGTFADSIIFLGALNNTYSHDVFAQNNIAYTSDISNGTISIIDVSKKDSANVISSVVTSRQFSHNAWVNNNASVLMTTDEKNGASVDVYDIRDLDNIELLEKFIPNRINDSRIIPHNVHILGNYAYTSWYTAGVSVADISDPSNVIEVAHFDSFTKEDNIPLGSTWFTGCWGAYPYLPSGLLLMSDINRGLIVLQPNLVIPARLQGNITDASTGLIIRNANISFVEDNSKISISDLEGNYKTGVLSSGTYTLLVDHPEYNQFSTTIELAEGDITTMDIQLESIIINIEVIDQSGNSISNPSMKIIDDFSGLSFNVTGDNDGKLSFNVGKDKSYTFIIGKWGFRENVNSDFTFTESFMEIELKDGFMDTFNNDYGWEKENNAASGKWTLEKPRTIYRSGMIVQNENDDTLDIGNQYYVTGAGDFSQGEDDVDAGENTLVSPAMDFSIYDSLVLSLSYWFTDEGGRIAANDSLLILMISENQDTIMLANIDSSANSWRRLDSLVFTAGEIDFSVMWRIEATINDDNENGHLVEGGIDNFRVKVFNSTTSTDDIDDIFTFDIFPNPTDNYLTVMCPESWKVGFIDIYTIDGRLLKHYKNSGNKNILSLSDLPVGLKVISVFDEKGGLLKSKQFLKIY